jgi:hypothetical protein
MCSSNKLRISAGRSFTHQGGPSRSQSTIQTATVVQPGVPKEGAVALAEVEPELAALSSSDPWPSSSMSRAVSPS